MQAFKSIGFLETEYRISLESWSSFLWQSLSEKLGTPVDPKAPLHDIGDLVPSRHIITLVDALRWLNLLPPSDQTESRVSLPPVPQTPQLPIDLFTTILFHKLRYSPSERDLVILSHEIIAQSHSSPTPEVHTSSLVTFGIPGGDSAMSRCVGLPVALAVIRVLDGAVNVRGVQGPTDESVYGGVLKGLEDVGLGMQEEVKIGKVGMGDILGDGLRISTTGHS
jgi:alpha-aminoadipic semialdehyde synthase